MDPNEEKEAERRREEEGAVLVRLQVLNKAGVSLEGVMHGRAERGAPCTLRGNMNKRKMFLDLNEPVPRSGATWVGSLVSAAAADIKPTNER